jgi:hypothetical protein
MKRPSSFLAPASDGELSLGTDLWQKGLVYTTRTGLLPATVHLAELPHFSWI